MTTRQTVLYAAGSITRLDGARYPVRDMRDIIMALPYDDCSATVWCLGQQDLMDILAMMLTGYRWNSSGTQLRLGECTGTIQADRTILSLSVKLDGRHRVRFLDLSKYGDYGGNALMCAEVLHDLQITSPTPGSAAVAQSIPRKAMKRFSQVYPPLDGVGESMVSHACRGGLVWLASPGIYHDVIDLDVNSMYPSILATSRLPYGAPVEVSGPEELTEEQWGVFEVDVMGSAYPGMPEWLSRRSRGRRAREMTTSCERGFEVFVLTSDDLEALRLTYDAEVVVHGGLAFDTCNPFFASSTARLGYLKDTAAPEGRGVYKTLLNAFVGKFAQARYRGKGIKVIPRLNEERRVVFEDVVDDARGAGVTLDVRYAPLAAAIWGKARLRLLKDMLTVREAGGEVVYCNTDGFMVRGLGLDRLGQLLPMGRAQGEYKVEAQFQRVNLLASNLYLGESSDGTRAWCHSGYMEDEVPTWDDFASGRYGHVYSQLS